MSCAGDDEAVCRYLDYSAEPIVVLAFIDVSSFIIATCCAAIGSLLYLLCRNDDTFPFGQEQTTVYVLGVQEHAYLAKRQSLKCLASFSVLHCSCPGEFGRSCP